MANQAVAVTDLEIFPLGCHMDFSVVIGWYSPPSSSSSFGGLLWNGCGGVCSLVVSFFFFWWVAVKWVMVELGLRHRWWWWLGGAGLVFFFFLWVVVEVGKRESLSRTMVRENKIKHNVINNYHNYVNIHDYGNKCVYLHIYTMWVVLG